MREFSPGLWVRPDNIEGGVVAVREALRGLRLPATCPIFSIRDCDERGNAYARTLWDADEILSRYHDLKTGLEASAARLPDMEETKAMAECFLLGGQAIRLLVLDPLLPNEIVPTAERDELVHAMRAYDQVGRRCWKPFLDRYGVLVGEPPMDRQVWRDATSGGGGDFTSASGELP